MKTNLTSSYVNYNGSGPLKFIGIIYGCDFRGDSEENCTSIYMIEKNGAAYYYKRPDAVITRGTRGFIRQDVWERNYKFAKLKGKYHTGTGNAIGVWSPDSVYEPIGDYNN